MDRSLLARRIAPFAVFAAVLGGIVFVGKGTGDGARREPRPLPLNAASGRNAEDAAAGTSAPGHYYWSKPHVPDALMRGLPTEGPAYEVRGNSARIAALAKALGVEGEVRRVDGGWSVGTGEKALQVMEYPGLPWYLGAHKGEGRGGVAVPNTGTVTEPKPAETKPAEPQTDPAPPADPSDAPDAPTTSGPADAPAKPVPCTTPTDGRDIACAEPAPALPPTLPPQPTDAQARAVMDRILAAVGRGEAAVTFAEGYSGKEVTAAPVLDGFPTFGWETRVTVEGDGDVAYASGYLSDAKPDTTYPLLDPRQALENVGHARDLPAGAEPAVGAPQPSGSPAVREATKVRLGLMFMPSWDKDAPAYLVPAWLLTFEGSTWEEPYLALPQKYVATPPASSGDPEAPVCDPSPCPDAPPPPDSATDGGGGNSGSVPGSTGAP